MPRHVDSSDSLDVKDHATASTVLSKDRTGVADGVFAAWSLCSSISGGQSKSLQDTDKLIAC